MALVAYRSTQPLLQNSFWGIHVLIIATGHHGVSLFSLVSSHSSEFGLSYPGSIFVVGVSCIP